MQVTHISYSTMGGAGRVAQTLVEAQKALGWDAELITVTDSNLWEHPLRNPITTAAAVIDNYVISNRSKPTPISLLRSKQSALGHLLPELKKKKNLHLHWMEGVLTIEEIAEIADAGVNIVWTLHDMAPFTGGCHHAFDCVQYFSGCVSCPQSRQMARCLVESNARRILNSNILSKVKVVAPSKWMASRASRSASYSGLDVYEIPNPISKNFFNLNTIKSSEKYRSHNLETMTFVAIANDLLDKNKNVHQIIDAFCLADAKREIDAKLLLVGRNGEKLALPSNKIAFLNPKSFRDIPAIIDNCDVQISASRAETFSLVIAEGQARGLTSLVHPDSAACELIENDNFGKFFTDAESLATQILHYSANKSATITNSGSIRRAAERFAPAKVAAEYCGVLYK